MCEKTGARFELKPTKSRGFCCVYGCHSLACRDTDLRFHCFPKENESQVKYTHKLGTEEMIDRRAAWIKKIGTGKEVTKSMTVCSLHFNPSDYSSPDVPSSKRYLKKTAIPTCNLPEKKDYKKVNEEQKTNRDERSRRRTVKVLAKDEKAEASIREEKDTAVEVQKEERTVPTTPEAEYQSLDLLPVRNETVDAATQVQSGDLFSNFTKFLNSDADLSTMTGIPFLSLLDTIEELVKELKPDHPVSKLSIRSVIIMTFMKFKMNCSYAVLAVLFREYTPESCSQRINEMINILYVVLKPVIFWPTREEIAQNIPKCFEGFETVRVISDCTEVAIGHPKKLCCQIATYSHYKGCNTLKFMTGVTPAGMISFVSEPYGGRASDKAIFEQSNIINLLEKFDAVMADKGFKIGELCAPNDITLVCPAFLEKRSQFPATEACETVSIASARVHIERANQRIKAFKILEKMPPCLVKKGGKIFCIVCAIVNLSAPILKDDKFYS